MIGGKGGTYRAWLGALHDGLPRFPFGGTGGDAERAFLDTRDLWEVIPVPGISKNDFQKLGKAILTEADAEEVSRSIVTDLLFRSLNAIDAVSRKDIAVAPSIFISYSRKDAGLVTRLRTLMRPAERRGLLSTWLYADIRSGHDWQPQIIAKINMSDLALLLVSENSLKSRYVRRIEIPAFARKKKKSAGGFRFYWSLIGPCDWRSVPELQDVQAIGSTNQAVSQSDTEADERCRLIQIVEEITRGSASTL